jgi:hypothetical protein
MSPPAETATESPATRLRRMERSMACFVSGLFALLPVVGIPLAVHGLLQFRASQLGSHRDWNPAARYRRWGALLSILGLGLHLVAVAALSLLLVVRMAR